MSRYATILTIRGVSQPADLKPKDQELFYKRFGGPGTRRKNPHRYDMKRPVE